MQVSYACCLCALSLSLPEACCMMSEGEGVCRVRLFLFAFVAWAAR